MTHAPHYERDGVALYRGDCREVVPALGAGWADVIVADPPYGETDLGWDRRVEGWLAAVGPALKPGGSLWCFGSLRSFMAERDAFAAWKLSQEIVWEKHNGSGLHTDRIRRVHEIVAHFYPSSLRWSDVYRSPVYTADATPHTIRHRTRPGHFGERVGWEGKSYVSKNGGPRLLRSVIFARSCQGRALHPTEKPQPIITPLIDYSCPPGGTVLVPFAGVGSEMVAAVTGGRRAVGVELDGRYCDLAAARLGQGVLPFGRDEAEHVEVEAIP